MYRHHEESLKIMEQLFSEREEVIALVFGGSVAKGQERPDSDLDGMAIVTDEYYEKLLEENRVLFPSNRRLEDTVTQVENKPEGIVELCREFCRTQDDALADHIFAAYHDWTSWEHPTDLDIFCSRYAADFEQWWLYPRPLIAEW